MRNVPACPRWVVCHEDRRSKRRCATVREMKEGPSRPVTFWIDEASKRVSFAEGVPLSSQRFDDRWISVTGGGVSYEFDRESRNLTFAGTIMKGGTATIIIGAGTCTVESDAR